MTEFLSAGLPVRIKESNEWEPESESLLQIEQRQ